MKGAIKITTDGGITWKEIDTIKGDKGDQGIQGDAGASAYTQATIGGYTGLLGDFYSDLASLQGLADLLASL